MANKDTTNKRRFTVWTLPAPDGTIDQADRQHKAWKYPGILTSTITSWRWLLLETGDHLLLEAGYNMMLEPFDGPDVRIGLAAAVRTGLVGMTTAHRGGIVGLTATQRTGIVGKAKVDQI
jgi:hypothetical protein